MVVKYRSTNPVFMMKSCLPVSFKNGLDVLERSLDLSLVAVRERNVGHVGLLLYKLDI